MAESKCSLIMCTSYIHFFGAQSMYVPTRAGKASRQRQRLASVPEVQTVNKLIEMVGRGDANISCVTEIARVMQTDGFNADALTALGSCGTGGKNSGNVERDLHRWLRGEWGFEVEPYEIQLELQATRIGLKGFIVVSVVWPLFLLVRGIAHVDIVHSLETCLVEVDFAEEAVPVAAHVLLPHELFHALSQRSDQEGWVRVCVSVLKKVGEF